MRPALLLGLWAMDWVLGWHASTTAQPIVRDVLSAVDPKVKPLADLIGGWTGPIKDWPEVVGSKLHSPDHGGAIPCAGWSSGAHCPRVVVRTLALRGTAASRVHGGFD